MSESESETKTPDTCERCGRPCSDPTLALTTASGRRFCGPPCFAGSMRDGKLIGVVNAATVYQTAPSVDPEPVTVTMHPKPRPWTGAERASVAEHMRKAIDEGKRYTRRRWEPVLAGAWNDEPSRSAAVDVKRAVWASGLSPFDAIAEVCKVDTLDAFGRAVGAALPISAWIDEPKVERCGCGHHDIATFDDPYLAHQVWCRAFGEGDTPNTPEALAANRVSPVAAARGIGVSAPEPEPLTVDDPTGDDVAPDMSPSEIRAWRERQR